PEFAARADTLPEQWAVVAGENYGQGSSREHAVMVPMSIGMKLVIARSFARIYRRNLINFGVIPLVFQDPEDYHKIDKNDLLVLNDLEKQIEADTVKVFNKTKNFSFMTRGDFSFKEKVLIRNGGLLNYLKFKFSPVS
ncbi:MAG: aconitate hydratase, partial [Deltaproteobacteria bacterium]|nr:aconitate hydratase [Deltaproteobacteria bacterium]